MPLYSPPLQVRSLYITSASTSHSLPNFNQSCRSPQTVTSASTRPDRALSSPIPSQIRTNLPRIPSPQLPSGPPNLAQIVPIPLLPAVRNIPPLQQTPTYRPFPSDSLVLAENALSTLGQHRLETAKSLEVIQTPTINQQLQPKSPWTRS
jgi:hypothetical protein